MGTFMKRELRDPEICKHCGHEAQYHESTLIGELNGIDLCESVPVPCVVDDCRCGLFEEEVNRGGDVG